ncbi:MAG: putative porin [Bacteroidales bacterium]
MINTWKLEHHFTRFEETPLDTNMHQLHIDYHPAFKQGFAYEYLGVLGDAMNHVDFFLRPESDAFVFGMGWYPYLKTPERTIFFNTRKPFTSLSYSTIPFVDWREENVEAFHTQNSSPLTNFGIDFNILAGKELYSNEDTRVNRIGLFGSHARNQYSIFGTFYYNDFRVEDHGGLAEIDPFLEGAQEQAFLYEMNLQEARSHYRNISLFVTQKYNLLEKKTVTDTLGNTTTTGKTLSLSHQLHAVRHLKEYRDVVDEENLSFYGNYYYPVPDAGDSVSEDRISNVFQLILGDPDYDRLSARVYAGYDLRRFGYLYPRSYRVFSHMDTVATEPELVLDSVFSDTAEAVFRTNWFNDLYLGFHLAGPTTGIWDWVIDGNYYLAGYYRNSFEINTTFSRRLYRKADLGIRGTVRSRKQHYFTNHYHSSFFQWENDFPSQYEIKGEAFVNSNELDLDMRVGAAYISNYLYWDQQAMPRVYDRDLLLLSGYFSKLFRISGFHSQDKILVQYTTAGEVLRLPVAALYTSNYWEQSLFQGALIGQLGFDLYATSRYRASGYMPATGIFHLQDQGYVGGYPFLDVFLRFRIKRTRFFVSYNNLLHGLWIIGNNYFTTYRYPMKPRNLRMGLVWTFYD